MNEFIAMKLNDQSFKRAVRRLNEVGRAVQRRVSKKGIRKAAAVLVALSRQVLREMGAYKTGALHDAIAAGSPDIQQNGDTKILVAIRNVSKSYKVTVTVNGKTFSKTVTRVPRKYVHLVHNGSFRITPKPFFEVAARRDPGPLLDAMRESMIEGAEEAIKS